MIKIPTNCPVCSFKLIRINDQLFCENEECEAKSNKQLLHFIKTMKIKGLGEKTLEKLSIKTINELYELNIDTLIDRLKSEKISIKIMDEINKSKVIPLNTFIQSFGIPLIGNSVSTKLSKATDSIWNIDKKVCSRVNLGDKATSNLLSWIEKNETRYNDLRIVMRVNKEVTKNVETQFKIVITGKLNIGSRNKAKVYFEEKGITVMSGLSKNVKYLVCDDDSISSKHSKAEQMNIPILTMNELILKEKLNDSN